ncbi:hypothetical protein HJA90_10980 [Rhizobium bangladeshense]|uniref:hypothetical protein n=1 Tax=Rhizobium bangladeshense TaxID=1138189 RepID=UPI001C833A8D|nr:hypothetical protein [Rhizobium bangladeshense]MBX4884103.1 hypothetical protein [Rhizobium bangladeshense]
MSLSEVFKPSGSNIVPVLSATALAMTSTMLPAPALVEDQKPSTMVRPSHAAAHSPTDVNFSLALVGGGQPRRVDTSQTPSHFTAFELHGRTAVSQLPPPLGFYRFTRGDISAPLNHFSPSSLAASFYETLPSEARNEVLRDIVSLVFAVNALPPRVEVVDGMTTIDFDAPGRLLSILIDGDTFYLSAFSRQKELKMTYVAESDVPRDEFIDVVWGQLREFSAAVKA